MVMEVRPGNGIAHLETCSRVEEIPGGRLNELWHVCYSQVWGRRVITTDMRMADHQLKVRCRVERCPRSTISSVRPYGAAASRGIRSGRAVRLWSRAGAAWPPADGGRQCTAARYSRRAAAAGAGPDGDARGAVVPDVHSEGAGWPRNRPDRVDDRRRGDRLTIVRTTLRWRKTDSNRRSLSQDVGLFHGKMRYRKVERGRSRTVTPS